MIYNTYSDTLDFIPNSSSYCFLDIETTGLSKLNDTIVCIGIAFPKEGSYHFSQWVIEKIEEESELIQTALHQLISFEKVYTYGGKQFEWPFLLQKVKKYQLNAESFTKFHLIDLKALKCTKNILEKELGFNRNFHTQGKKLAKLCQLTLSTPNSTYQSLISEHNKEELISLITFYHFYKFLNHLNQAILLEYHFKKNTLIFSLEPSRLYPYSFQYKQDYIHVFYDASINHLSISLEAVFLNLKAYLPHHDYYIVEGELMHKSLAKLLPASMRTKATKSTCYLEQQTFYLPLKLAHQSLYWEDAKKQIYTPFNQEALLPYINDILKLSIKKLIQKL